MGGARGGNERHRLCTLCAADGNCSVKHSQHDGGRARTSLVWSPFAMVTLASSVMDTFLTALSSVTSFVSHGAGMACSFYRWLAKTESKCLRPLHQPAARRRWLRWPQQWRWKRQLRPLQGTLWSRPDFFVHFLVLLFFALVAPTQSIDLLVKQLQSVFQNVNCLSWSWTLHHPGNTSIMAETTRHRSKECTKHHRGIYCRNDWRRQQRGIHDT